jgi:hypothetical protein
MSRNSHGTSDFLPLLIFNLGNGGAKNGEIKKIVVIPIVANTFSELRISSKSTKSIKNGVNRRDSSVNWRDVGYLDVQHTNLCCFVTASTNLGGTNAVCVLKDRYHAGRRLFFFCTKVYQVKSVLQIYYLYCHEFFTSKMRMTMMILMCATVMTRFENGQILDNEPVYTRSQWIWLKRLEFWAVRNRLLKVFFLPHHHHHILPISATRFKALISYNMDGNMFEKYYFRGSVSQNQLSAVLLLSWRLSPVGSLCDTCVCPRRRSNVHW